MRGVTSVLGDILPTVALLLALAHAVGNANAGMIYFRTADAATSGVENTESYVSGGTGSAEVREAARDARFPCSSFQNGSETGTKVDGAELSGEGLSIDARGSNSSSSPEKAACRLDNCLKYGLEVTDKGDFIGKDVVMTATSTLFPKGPTTRTKGDRNSLLEMLSCSSREYPY